MPSFGPGGPCGRLSKTSGRDGGETKASSPPGHRLGLACQPAGGAERVIGPRARGSGAPIKQGPVGRPDPLGPASGLSRAPQAPLPHSLPPRPERLVAATGRGRPVRGAPAEQPGARRNPTSVCTMRSQAHSCRHRGKKGRKEGGDLVTGDDSLRRALSCLLFWRPRRPPPGPLSRRLPIVPALRTAGDGGPRQQGGPSSPTPLLPAPGGPAEAPTLLAGQHPPPARPPGALSPDPARAEGPLRDTEMPQPSAQGSGLEGLRRARLRLKCSKDAFL